MKKKAKTGRLSFASLISAAITLFFPHNCNVVSWVVTVYLEFSWLPMKTDTAFENDDKAICKQKKNTVDHHENVKQFAAVRQLHFILRQYACKHACTHTHTHTRTHTRTHAYTHACTHAHTHTRARARDLSVILKLMAYFILRQSRRTNIDLEFNDNDCVACLIR